MARPLRIEFPGALYHVTSRGDRREPIFDDDEDRLAFLRVFAEVVERFNWICHAYCLMTDHYHLVVETPDGNLSKGMRQLNGVYTQASNRRHHRGGHLFQGRFKAILVDKDSYLLELARYVVLNPVRAGMVAHPRDYPWSSYRAMMGKASSPAWLATQGLLALFASRQSVARRRYARFVAEGMGKESLWTGLRQQIYLGDEKFVQRMQERAAVQGDRLSIPRAQRRAPPKSLAAIEARHQVRNEAIIEAYSTGAYSYREIAEHFGLHLATVGRIVRSAMQQSEVPVHR
jgi:putative transposase